MGARSIIFLGNFYSPNLLKTIRDDSKGSVSFATHNYEMSLFRGFLSHDDLIIDAFVVPSIYSYPKYHKHWKIDSEDFSIERAKVRSIGFINLPVIKDIHRSISLFFSLTKCLRRRKENVTKVFVSCPYSYLLGPLFFIRRFFSRKIDVTLLIMDMPAIVYEMDGYKGLKGWVLSVMNNSVMKKVAKCDKLVLMTEPMMEFISSNPPHIIAEGIVDIASMSKDYMPLEKNDKEIILYTGTLRAIFGVRNLVDAFEQANLKDTELWICGSGDSKEYIEERAANNKNIRFFGLVDAKTALEFQRKATILVNPRTSEGKFTKYSFPSKTMEYLLAGKSVIINKLPGIPDEYYRYVYTPSDESITALSSILNTVVNTSFNERQKKALEGRNYVVNQKNSHVQAGRVLDLMYS